jgi:hypothetical protein
MIRDGPEHRCKDRNRSCPPRSAQGPTRPAPSARAAASLGTARHQVGNHDARRNRARRRRSRAASDRAGWPSRRTSSPRPPAVNCHRPCSLPPAIAMPLRVARAKPLFRLGKNIPGGGPARHAPGAGGSAPRARLHRARTLGGSPARRLPAGAGRRPLGPARIAPSRNGRAAAARGLDAPLRRPAIAEAARAVRPRPRSRPAHRRAARAGRPACGSAAITRSVGTIPSLPATAAR